MRVRVTGAASGIGRVACLRLAPDARARGETARVAAVDLAPGPGLESLADGLRKLGTEALILAGDVGRADGPAAAAADAVRRFGGLDGLLSRAGFNRPGAPAPLGRVATPEDAGDLFLGRLPGLARRTRG